MSGDHLEMSGTVVDSVKGTLYVEVESGQVVKAYIGGKLKKNKIMVMVGDSVKVKISPYDLTNGIIVYRK
jgi:translation initiation factor IF-1